MKRISVAGLLAFIASIPLALSVSPAAQAGPSQPSKAGGTLVAATTTRGPGPVAAAQAGGSISGTVTAAVGGADLQGICVGVYTPNGPEVTNTATAADGTYTISGLAPGNYQVQFFVGCGNTGSYLAQWYNDQPTQATATTVSVTASQTTLGPNSSLVIQVEGVDGLPGPGLTAAVMNVTVTDTSSSSFLTVWPPALARPTASDLNWVAKETVPNLVVATLGANGAIAVYNAAGSVDVVMDVSGWYS